MTSREKNLHPDDSVICIDLTDDNDITPGTTEENASHSCTDKTDTTNLSILPPANSVEINSTTDPAEKTASVWGAATTDSNKNQISSKRQRTESDSFQTKKLKETSQCGSTSQELQGKIREDPHCAENQEPLVFLKMKNTNNHPVKDLKYNEISSQIDSLKYEYFPITESEIKCLLRIAYASVHTSLSKNKDKSLDNTPNVSEEVLSSNDNILNMNSCIEKMAQEINTDDGIEVICEANITKDISFNDSSDHGLQGAERRSSQDNWAVASAVLSTARGEVESEGSVSNSQTIINENWSKDRQSRFSSEASITDNHTVLNANHPETKSKNSSSDVALKAEAGHEKSVTDILSKLDKPQNISTDTCNEYTPDQSKNTSTNSTETRINDGKLKLSDPPNPNEILDDEFDTPCLDNERLVEESRAVKVSLNRDSRKRLSEDTVNYGLHSYIDSEAKRKRRCSNYDSTNDFDNILHQILFTLKKAKNLEMNQNSISNNTDFPGLLSAENDTNSKVCNNEEKTADLLPSSSNINQMTEYASKPKQFNDQVLINENQKHRVENIFSNTNNVTGTTSEKIVYNAPDFQTKQTLAEFSNEMSNMKKLSSFHNIANEDSIKTYQGNIPKGMQTDSNNMSDEVEILAVINTKPKNADCSDRFSDNNKAQNKNTNHGSSPSRRYKDFKYSPHHLIEDISNMNNSTLQSPLISTTVVSNMKQPNSLDILKGDFISSPHETSLFEYKSKGSMPDPIYNSERGSLPNYGNDKEKSPYKEINMENTVTNSFNINAELQNAMHSFIHLTPTLRKMFSKLIEDIDINKYDSFPVLSSKKNLRPSNVMDKENSRLRDYSSKTQTGKHVEINSSEQTIIAPQENNNTKYIIVDAETDTSKMDINVEALSPNDAVPNLKVTNRGILYDILKGTGNPPSDEIKFCAQMPNSHVASNINENTSLPECQAGNTQNEIQSSESKSDLLKSFVNSVDMNVEDLQNILGTLENLKTSSSPRRLTKELSGNYSSQILQSVSSNIKLNADGWEEHNFHESNDCSNIPLDNGRGSEKKENELQFLGVQTASSQKSSKYSYNSTSFQSVCSERNSCTDDLLLPSPPRDSHVGKKRPCPSLIHHIKDGSISSPSSIYARKITDIKNFNSPNCSDNSYLRTERTMNEFSGLTSNANISISTGNKLTFSADALKNLLNTAECVESYASRKNDSQKADKQLSVKMPIQNCAPAPTNLGSVLQQTPEVSGESESSILKKILKNLNQLALLKTKQSSSCKALFENSQNDKLEKRELSEEHSVAFSSDGSTNFSINDSLLYDKSEYIHKWLCELEPPNKDSMNIETKGVKFTKASSHELGKTHPDNFQSQTNIEPSKSFSDFSATPLQHAANSLDIPINNLSGSKRESKVCNTVALDRKSNLVKDEEAIPNNFSENNICTPDDSVMAISYSMPHERISQKVGPTEIHSEFHAVPCKPLISKQSLLSSPHCANSCSVPVGNVLRVSEREREACKRVASDSLSNLVTTGKEQLSEATDTRQDFSEECLTAAENSKLQLPSNFSHESGSHTEIKEKWKESRALKIDTPGKSLGICLVPKQLKSMVGYKIIDTESVMLLMLEWKVSWLAQQLKTDPPPPICKTLKKVKNSYESFDEYYNTYLPLMLLDTWHRLFISWRDTQNSHPFSCDVTSHLIRNHYLKFECVTVIDGYPKGLYPSEGRFSIITFCANEKGSNIKAFGYISQVTTRAFNPVSDSKLRSYKALEDAAENLKVLNLSIRVVYDLRTCDLTLPVSVQMLCNIRTIFKQNDAMLYLKKSPLFSSILSPVKELKNFELTFPDSDANKVFKRVCDITQSISISYPIPSLVTVQCRCELDRLRFIPLLVENLKAAHSCKVLLCERTVSSLNLVADSICQRKSLNMVIVNKRCEINQNLVRCLLNERVAAKVNWNKNSLSDSSRVSRIRKNVLQECDVVMVLIRNSHDIFLNEAIANSEKISHLCCIVDEASLCTETDTLIPVMHGVSKLILIGDPHSEAKALSNTAKAFEYHKSFLQRVNSLHGTSN